jgi:small redox-active disulfide protein 2
MEIKVLGSGCASCKKLLKVTNAAVKNLNSDVQVLYVTDMEEIIKTGIMSTPGLMINGTIKVMGRVPKQKEVEQIISDEA